MFTIYRDAYINFNDQGPIPFQINFENILPKGFVSYSLQQKVYSADGVHISPSIYKKRRRIIPCRCQNFYDLKSRKKLHCFGMIQKCLGWCWNPSDRGNRQIRIVSERR